MVNRGQATPENSILLFGTVIAGLLDWLGVGWTAEQSMETAELMSAEYHWMSLAEIKAFTSKIKAGHFGKEWGKLRPMMLMGWMLDWSGEVLEARAGKIGKARPVETAAEDEPEGTIDISESESMQEFKRQMVEKINEDRRIADEESQNAIARQQSRMIDLAKYSLAGRMAAGEPLRNEQEQTFYNEHRAVIDALAQALRNPLNH
jgi:hypothetical protein